MDTHTQIPKELLLYGYFMHSRSTQWPTHSPISWLLWPTGWGLGLLVTDAANGFEVALWVSSATGIARASARVTGCVVVSGIDGFS